MNITVSDQGNGIIEFRINRPTMYNAIDIETMDELKENIRLLHMNEELRALVITGEGEKAFCSGGDVKAFDSLRTKNEAYQMLSKMGKILYEIMTLPIPTFALLNGVALGGGCELATACDFRVAKKGVSVGFIQGNLAITTGWGGASMLHEKLQYDKAMMLLLSGKKITAEEGQSLGFIQKVVSHEKFREEAYDYIKNSLVEHPNVLKAYKTVKVNQWQQTHLHTRMISEITRCAELWELEDHHQAVSLFLNRKSK